MLDNPGDKCTLVLHYYEISLTVTVTVAKYLDYKCKNNVKKDNDNDEFHFCITCIE